GGPRRHGHHMVDVRVALEDVLGVAEHQHVERRPRKSPPHGANEWRGEQHIAEAAQRDHEDARVLGQLKARHRNVPRKDPLMVLLAVVTVERRDFSLKKGATRVYDPSARRARDRPQSLSRQGAWALMSPPRPLPPRPPRATSYRRSGRRRRHKASPHRSRTSAS